MPFWSDAHTLMQTKPPVFPETAQREEGGSDPEMK